MKNKDTEMPLWFFYSIYFGKGSKGKHVLCYLQCYLRTLICEVVPVTPTTTELF